MSPLRRLLLVPLLAPLLALLLLAALNPRPSLSLRLLTARTASLPLGVWLAAAGLGGAACSAVATTLALRQAGGARRRSPAAPEAFTWSPPRSWDEAPPPERGAPRGSARQPAAAAGWSEAGPARPPGEPAPTVSVPFRVIRRPATASAQPSDSWMRDEGPAPASRQEQGGGPDDWQEQGSEEW